jgi:GMP synthase (glutamine-hydrolysing)
VYEWHEDEVARAPRGFDVLARSASCAVEAMAHRSRTVVGVQFHPEAWRLMGSRGEGNEHGEQLLGNFLRLAGARER